RRARTGRAERRRKGRCGMIRRSRWAPIAVVAGLIPGCGAVTLEPAPPDEPWPEAAPPPRLMRREAAAEDDLETPVGDGGVAEGGRSDAGTGPTGPAAAAPIDAGASAGDAGASAPPESDAGASGAAKPVHKKSSKQAPKPVPASAHPEN